MTSRGPGYTADHLAPAFVLLLSILSVGCERSTRREIIFAASAVPLSADSVTVDLYAVREDGSGRRRLTHGRGTVSNFPTWSPDGRHVAYVAPSGPGSALRIMERDGANDRQVARFDSARAAFPDWSPDGRRILFIAGRAGPPSSPTAVYMVDRDGSNLRVVLSDSSHYDGPSWLPEGDEFVVSSLASGTSRILRVRLSAAEPETLITTDRLWLACPAPSPDGSLVLMNGGPAPSTTPSPETGTFQVNVYVMQSDGSGLRPLTTGPVITNNGRWSRDNLRIVMQSNRHMARAPGPLAALDSLELYVMRPDGTQLTRITFNQRFDAHPSW